MEDAQVQATDKAPNPNDRINISGDVVKTALGGLVRAGEISPEHEGAIWWFYCFSREKGWNLKEAAKEIGKDSTTLWRVFNGKYGASLENIAADIARFKSVEEKRESVVRLDFVETSTWTTVNSICQNALASQSIAFVFGESQIGKTTCLLKVAHDNNHGATKYVRLPASGGIRLFAQELAKSCYVSPDQSFENLRDRILRSIDSRTLVIIDELHQVFTSYLKGSAIKVLEFIREIYDRTQCGMVLCGTDVLEYELQRGKLALMLKQFNRRGLMKVHLPSRTPHADLVLVASKFGLPEPTGPAKKIVDDMIADSGLGMYIKFLQAAATKAKKGKGKITWDHFVNAYDIIQRLSINPNEIK